MKQQLIGRKQESKQMKSFLHSEKSEFIVVYGRLMIASVACTSDFEHRIYNRNLSAGCG